MEEIKVHIPEEAAASYPILVGEGLLEKIEELSELSSYTRVAVITDKTISGLWFDTLQKSFSKELERIEIEAGEKAKNQSSLSIIWQQMLDAKFDRKSLVLNLGGGVIGDLGGFAAQTYMRGIDFIQLPTTLLAQVDASVGGKLGFDFGGIKNSIGVFAQPKAVIMDTLTLGTLPKNELRAGYAEVLKHGLIYDRDFFEECAGQDILALQGEARDSLIAKNCTIKAAVVERDEKEGNIRKILNFGHTIGHALEALSHEGEDVGWKEAPLLHGEAVALGMLAESHLSMLAGYLEEQDLERVRTALTEAILPVRCSSALDPELILEKLFRDKKNVGGEVRWTLLEAIGKACFDQLVPQEQVLEALGSI